MITWERAAELARELPEIEETTSWGKPAFKVRGKAFAGLSTRHGARRGSLRPGRAARCSSRRIPRVTG